MGKTFRDWDIEQLMMFPPSVEDFVPQGHVAHFVRSTVSEALDLSAIVDCYNEERGYPPYHPVMMTALLLYAYCQGIYPSRRIAKACRERVDFMAVTGMQTPDFRTISDFRKRHMAALEELFVQVLRLCQEAGLVKLGHVALDGTKLKANASKHKAMSYGRMKKAEPELEAIVRGWLRQAEAADLRDDQEHGVDLNGEELPDWVRDKQRRLEKIREARARLQAEAQAAEKGEEKKSGGPGRPRKNEPGTPKDSAQTNFTDPQSRIMKSHDGFIQGYNAQAVVDADSQVIVAQGLTNNASDAQQLAVMVAQIKQNTGRQARELSADAGYCSEDNLKELRRRHINGYIATGRQKHGQATAAAERNVKLGTYAYAMWQKLRRGGHRSRYRLRKQTVEPVFGQVKQGRGFRQFLLRGLRKVAGEWSLICTAHNLLKLAAARS
ncbi:MAG: IS1182 family transposase [Deltaproteobacteria bacterium]|nr:MAG: IS1182 family transposase [Deltaproteobacteria bacterium]